MVLAHFVEIMGIPFISTTMDSLIEQLDERLEAEKQTFLVTANPEILMAADRDQKYYKTIQSADFVIPDGIGILVGAKILGNSIAERLPGFDLTLGLFKLAAQKGYKIFMLGAQESTLKTAVQKVQDWHPGIQIVGYQHGYTDVNAPEVIEAIREADPDIVLVGLGFPKQEYWIDTHKATFKKGLFIGVGGSFDGIAGNMKRAPEIWRRLNVEWLYRLIQQPSRWRRMLALPAFVLKMGGQRLGKKPKR